MALSKCFPCLQFRLEEIICKLDFSNNILSDAFPQVWQYERTLEELNVTSTRINNLPPQLFYCQGLKVLLANNNNIENIPEAVGALRQLQQLNLSRNFISSVPDNIKACKHLTHLDLSCNTLQRLPDAITSLISLEELVLNETNLEFLPANFGRLVNLRIVELRSNNLLSLPKSMQRLTNLQRLDIGGNEFRKMPEVIGELKQLRELWFDFNQIRTVPVQIGKLRELQHCEANGNFINFLPNEISNWRNLEVLSLSTNCLSTFPFSIGMLKYLVTFKCEMNELTELPDSISNLENLEELVVSHNKLICLPNTIGMLRKLRYLFADNNDLLKLPDEICSCSFLSVLSVSRNKISELPNNIGHLTKLKVLNIVQNNIDTLPVTLLSLVNLTSLWISNNQSQPLMPLQYADVSKKTLLTCFMLPQLRAKDYVQPTRENEVYSNSRHQQQNLLNTSTTIPSSTRRICFADETTILNQTSLSSRSFSTHKINNNNVKHEGGESTSSLAKTYASSLSTTTSNDAVPILRDGIKLVPAGSKDFLMRSPTPYPKELRLMAKYARSNNLKSLNIQNNENNSINKDVYSIQHAMWAPQEYHNSDIPACGSKSYYQDSSTQRQLLTEEDPRNEQHSYENNVDTVQTFSLPAKYCQNQHNISNHLEPSLPLTIKTSQQQQFIIPSGCNNAVQPPPYHIARCFTKKTIEDLTNYEVIRKQRHSKIENNENSDLNQELNNEHITKLTILDEYEKEELDQNYLLSQHAFTEEEEENENRPLNFPMEQPPRGNNSDIDKKVLTDNNNATEDCEEIPPAIRLISQKSNKVKTPWLFGVHRNPTVKQVTIKLVNRSDFEIDSLPNKEGIYVVSTINESNVSRLLHAFDKLLEVDGIDFTNISIHDARQEGIYVVSTINESNVSRLLHAFDKLLEVDGIDFTNISIHDARQVLNNTGPLINIMLSRK